jgi:hypothetical protein
MVDLYPPLQFLPSLSAVIRGEPASPFFFIANPVIDRLNQTPIQLVTIVLCFTARSKSRGLDEWQRRFT